MMRFYYYLLILLAALFVDQAALAETTSNPCAGPSALLSLVNRPTQADSACVVPFKEGVLEAGYQYRNLTGGGSAQNYPEAELRFGLPIMTEFVILLPNYNLQTVAPRSGYDASMIGVKHGLGNNEHWLGAIEGLLTLPTGGGAFGRNKYNPVVNGIVEYSFNPSLSLTLMLGVGSQSVPALNGGDRYTTVNPDLVLSWLLNEKVLTYGEIYGQSHVGPHQGAGFNTDIGMLYQFLKFIALDAEFGHRVSGSLDGFNNYYGIGASFLIG